VKTLRYFLVFSILLAAAHADRSNSEIFPATAAAADKIGWKDGYFVINGQPAYISSGKIDYARVPRELWRDRLWRAKQIGLDRIQSYVFWNVSEPKEKQWDFSDGNDLDAWLSLIQELGMYATVRVGPYSCAQWDDGGLPAWLTGKKDMVARANGEQFLTDTDEHLAKIYQIVAKHQVIKGGNVIIVQLENEHPSQWGTYSDPYLNHLYGTIAGLGNALLKSTEPFQGATCHVYHGRALIVLRGSKAIGTLHLKADSPGLASSSVAISSQ
jgi:beta-galactosidase